MSMAPATIFILVITAIATFISFQRRDLWERWMFKPEAILRYKQFDRMLTSGLIHADWMHFTLNAYSLYSFGRGIEVVYGARTLLLVYLSSILGGSLLSLLIHRHHDYRALGASGGVCGVIFASIFLLPGGGIAPLFLPIRVPALVYAVGFLIFSYVALRRRADNIGHDAHLGGAIVGLLVAAALYPSLIFAAPAMFWTVLGLSVLILLALVFDPLHLLQIKSDATGHSPGGERFRRYAENRNRNRKIAEIDRLLDKVGENGIHSLSERERQKLDQLSKEIGRR
jgi:membrane associated rhomboid family serine protease